MNSEADPSPGEPSDKNPTFAHNLIAAFWEILKEKTHAMSKFLLMEIMR